MRKNTKTLILIVAISLLFLGKFTTTVQRQREYSNPSERKFSPKINRLYPKFILSSKENTSEEISEKKATELNLNLRRENGSLVFSGFLTADIENKGLEERKIIVYKVLKKENETIENTLTKKNGKFNFTGSLPEKKGLFLYKAYFEGDRNYQKSQSNLVSLRFLNKTLVISLSFIFFSALLLVVGYLLIRGKNFSSYSVPLLLASLTGSLLFVILGTVSILIAGILFSLFEYLMKKNIGGWLDHLKIGSVGGVVIFDISGTLTLISLFVSPNLYGLTCSTSQNVFLGNFFLGSLPTVIIFGLGMGTGAAGTEILRKFLRD